MTHQRPLLIIGLGLAGTVTAIRALQRGHQVTCVDKAEQAIASRAAAGVLNPVTGPRLNLSWQVHSQMPEALAFYRDCETRWGQTFVEERTVRRIFTREEELDYHARRFKNQETHAFLGERIPSAEAPFGRWGECHLNAAVLDIDHFLETAREWLQSQCTVLDETFPYASLEVEDKSARWRGERFKHVIFCEGASVRHNPWFGKLPFKPAKGESLKVELTHPLPPPIISAQKWILPLPNQQARIGSTYGWETLDNNPTDEARETLLRKAAEILPENPVLRVLEHRAGVRPCSHDTRPYAGRHPHATTLAILNGLGSKGTLMSPWCADRLLAHLETNEPLHPQMDIARLKKRKWVAQD